MASAGRAPLKIDTATVSTGTEQVLDPGAALADRDDDEDTTKADVQETTVDPLIFALIWTQDPVRERPHPPADGRRQRAGPRHKRPRPRG